MRCRQSPRPSRRRAGSSRISTGPYAGPHRRLLRSFPNARAHGSDLYGRHEGTRGKRTPSVVGAVAGQVEGAPARGRDAPTALADERGSLLRRRHGVPARVRTTTA
jgi:hypothetical protein